MKPHRRVFFTLQELLMMAALGALGGVCSSFLSNIRAALHTMLPSPIGMQPLAGIHVVWFVIAIGLVRKPGAATVTGLLSGAVEFLTGNPHGLIVLAYSVLGGMGVDIGWLLLGGRESKLGCAIAGGIGAATNVVLFAFTTSMPANTYLFAVLAAMVSVAFVSGAIIDGFLGHWLLQTLRKAGIGGAGSPQGSTGGGFPVSASEDPGDP